MKKLLFGIVIAMIALATACSGGQGGKLVGVAMPTQSLQRWNQDGANMKAKLEEKGYKVELQYAQDDVNAQVQQIENMITKGCKTLVIASIDGASMTNVLKTAKARKVQAIAYDRLLMNTPDVDYYATFDNFKVGAIQGKFIEDKLGLKTNKGPFNIELFVGSLDDNNAKLFNQGAMSVIQPCIDSGVLVVPSGQTAFTAIAIPNWNSGTAQKPYPVLTGQQSMSVFKDTRTLAAKVVEMVDAVMAKKTVPVNDTATYNNGVKVVPSFLCESVFADKGNYKALLLDTGYYTEADIQ